MKRRDAIRSLCGFGVIFSAGCLEPDCETCFYVSNATDSRVNGVLRITSDTGEFKRTVDIPPHGDTEFKPGLVGDVTIVLAFGERMFEKTISIESKKKWGQMSIRIYADDVTFGVYSH